MDISKVIQEWYAENKRDLPWRHTSDPYKIWVSEIILQQTRVQQGLSYYLNFIGQFPDLESLAMASQDEVMSAWKGLGYYSRARHMHSTARTIVESFGGIFPGSFKEIIRLKGIGPYTAAAISSFAFGEPQPVIDGNVARVISRLFGIGVPINSLEGRKLTEEKARDLIDRTNPGNHNQAMMEFGALLCTPTRPACHTCPLTGDCTALATGQTSHLPLKTKNIDRKERFFNYLLLTDNTNILIRKRSGTDIWKGLYELPLLETDSLTDPAELKKSNLWRELEDMHGPFEILNCSEPVKHHLTHRIILATFCHLRCGSLNPENHSSFRVVPVSDWRKIAFPRLVERYLENRLLPI